jgi:hypothetical protein
MKIIIVVHVNDQLERMRGALAQKKKQVEVRFRF